ncbi:MAG: nicotinate-nucleotide--dimethylbenzimidazole phosphoribosyltransferase [Nitrospinaceae bacterium]|nr:nicotinate-nucleotide--dimethylbenzimidazole phosphoribosyltransferase [Nitrospinaceae bacterium]
MVLPTTAMLDLIRDTLDAIKPIPLLRFETAQAHLDSLTKPPGSLGLLEDLAKKYKAIRDTDHPSVNRKSVVVFAADHGVTEEGISAYPAKVTAQMVQNFLDGGAAVNVLALYFEDQNLSAGSHRVLDFSFTGSGEVIYKDDKDRLWKMGQLISD